MLSVAVKSECSAGGERRRLRIMCACIDIRPRNVVGPLVIRVPGAVYARGRTYAAALRLFEQSQARGDVEVVLE
jgi:hypothetical protein